MKYCRISRRHFLQGAGGFALSLPFLPSLMPRTALGEVPVNAKFFIHLSSDHGGLHPSRHQPNVANYQWTAAEQTEIYPGNDMLGTRHVIRHKRLSELLFNGQVSEMWHSGFNGLLGKMNLIEGLGLMFGGGHHQGGFLGNFHGNDGRDFRTGIDSRLVHTPPVETIDQIMSKSAAFYAPGDPHTMPALQLGPGGRSPSWSLVNGVVQPTTHVWSIQDIYDYIFGGTNGLPAAPSRIAASQRIREDYQRLLSPATSAGARLSRDDAEAVENHLENLVAVERRLANITQAASCNTVGESSTHYGPTNPNNQQNAFQQSNRQLFASQWAVYVRLITTAINCGMMRVLTVPFGTPTDYIAGNGYHHDIAHNWHLESSQPTIRDAHTYLTTHFILPLLTALNDVRTANGGRLLDNGLVVYQPECWYATHDGQDLPTMMAGSAGGFFRTGYYIDYRNLMNRGLQASAWNSSTQSFNAGHPYTLLYPGLPMNRWLHTVLAAMGISRQEYLARANLPPNTTMHGYGDHTVSSWDTQLTFRNTIGSATQQVTHTAWPQHVINDCSSLLPAITTV